MRIAQSLTRYSRSSCRNQAYRSRGAVAGSLRSQASMSSPPDFPPFRVCSGKDAGFQRTSAWAPESFTRGRPVQVFFDIFPGISSRETCGELGHESFPHRSRTLFIVQKFPHSIFDLIYLILTFGTKVAHKPNKFVR